MSSESSAEQMHWVELAEQSRIFLAKRVPELATMDPEKASHLVSALRACLFFEQNASYYDAQVEAEKTRKAWD